MAAKQLRRRPCEHCRRRQRRFLAKVATVAGGGGLAALLALSLEGGNSVQLANAAVTPHTTASISAPDATSPAIFMEQFRAHRSQIKITHVSAVKTVERPAKVIARPATIQATTATTAVSQPAPSYTSPAPSYTSPAPVRTQTTYTPPPPPPKPSPTQATTAASSSGRDLGAQLLAEAMTRAGDPYAWGGAGPSSFDCSGLIYWAAIQIGISNMPRDTYSMLGQGVSSGLLVPTSNPQPGDLAFFGTGHVELVTSRADYTWGAQKSGTVVGYNQFYPGSYAPTAYYRLT